MGKYLFRTNEPATINDAEELKKFFARYVITVSGLTVTQITKSGKRVRDNAMERTASDVGSASLMAGIFSSGSALIASALGPWGIIFALAMPFNVKAMHAINKRTPATADALYTEIAFDFANVSSKRIGWAEYLIMNFGARKGWMVTGTSHQKAPAGALKPDEPTPWLEKKHTNIASTLKKWW
jgi:hypothetical protein